MSQTPPHVDVLPDGQHGAGGWPPPPAPAQDAVPPAVVWGPPPGASWSAPGALPWAPPVAGPVAGPAAPRPRRGGNPLLLTLVAVIALLVGAVGAGFLVSALYVAGADDMGREMGREMGEEISRSMEDTVGGFMEGPWASGEGVPTGPVEQFPAVEPGPLGPDPVLDEYAGACFAGDLQACDDLYYESPPMSDYEEYAGTCGGRVKLWSVMYCTELE